jgi:hypothetical protein
LGLVVLGEERDVVRVEPRNALLIRSHGRVIAFEPPVRQELDGVDYCPRVNRFLGQVGVREFLLVVEAIVDAELWVLGMYEEAVLVGFV